MTTSATAVTPRPPHVDPALLREDPLTPLAALRRDHGVIAMGPNVYMALREGEALDIRYAILDEFHYYGDRDRGAAWQVPLLTMPQSRFLLMSATLGDTRFFEQALTELTGVPTELVASTGIVRLKLRDLRPGHAAVVRPEDVDRS